MSQSFISIVICTYNRGRMLAETLSSFSAMELPTSGSMELLIVDNRSTDSTKQVTDEFVSRDGGYVRYIYEPKQGLSHARNTGIAAARGEIIAFVDDDVYFDRGWLNTVINAFRVHPDADALGGKSVPIFEGGRPSWMEENFLSLYGDTGFGDDSRWLTYPEHPFGLNMAFRRSVFERIGAFNPDLGRKKRSLLSNEESELFHRISANGSKVYYAPSALLHHRIPKNRVDPRWIVERYYWQGISSVVQNQMNDKTGRFALFADAAWIAWRALRVLQGGFLSPRRIYWHYRGIALRDKAYLFCELGKARQKFRLAIGL